MKESGPVVNWRRRAKKKLIAYKGGKCQKCSYREPYPTAFVFHHRDPTKKEFTIGGKSMSFEKLRKEADKCDLLCVRCHAELHDEEYAVGREAAYKAVEQASGRIRKPCTQCRKWFSCIKSSKQKCCSPKCSQKSRRVTKRPYKSQLVRLLGRKSWSYIGRKYNVSDNAVRKWAKNYGLID